MSLITLDSGGNETEMRRETASPHAPQEGWVFCHVAAVPEQLPKAKNATGWCCPYNYEWRQNGIANKPNSGQRSG